jgi:Rieske Fe-S protein
MKFPGEVREGMYFTKWPTEAWWNHLRGREIRVTDFDSWQGASGVWRGLFYDGRWVPGTGYPVLVIRIPREAPEFQAPQGVVLPEGFDLFYDDPDREIRIVSLYDRCPHLCCPPGWHVITDTNPGRDYIADSPTYRVYGQDPIFCVCHGSQYDPLLLVEDVNTRNGARYVGAKHVHRPTWRALPVIPVRVDQDQLVGGMPNPAWYDPACA